MSTTPEAMQMIKAFQNPEFKKRFLLASGCAEAVFEREIAFANIAIASSKQLQKCSVESLLKAVYSVATTGLSLNPVLKYAALVPRYVQGNNEAVLFPMYQGLLKLVTDTGNVSVIQTHIVYDGDEFEIVLGSSYEVHHSPKFKTKKPLGVYSIARLKDGNSLIEHMTNEEVEAIREMSDSWKSHKAGRIPAEQCIWVKHEGEMYRKTVLRRLVKYLPKKDNEQLAEALHLDEGDYAASHGKATYIESLMLNCTLDPEEIVIIERRIADPTMSNAEADMFIERLVKNQILTDKQQLKQQIRNPAT